MEKNRESHGLRFSGSNHRNDRRGRWAGLFVTLAVFFGLSAVGGAAWAAWNGDFLDAGASGNATYEAMVIAPSAIYDEDTNTTVVAYQGSKLDPYVCVFDHATKRWSEPVRVGDNAYLAGRMDTHGGPSIIREPDGMFHVFWGAHNSDLRHATSKTPGKDGSWRLAPVRVDGVPVPSTYPRPELYEQEGIPGLRVWLRLGSDKNRGDIASIVTTDGVTWSSDDTIVKSGPDSLWYESIYTGDEATHIALTRAPRANSGNADPFVREGLYYLQSKTEGVWTEASGTVLLELPVPKETIMETCTVVSIPKDDEINQVVVRELADGNPCILFLQGDTAAPKQEYSWLFTRYDGSKWTNPVLIAKTDNFFDAADLEVGADGKLRAYVTTGGTSDSQANVGDRYASRGGDLAIFTSSDSGKTWTGPEWVKRQKDERDAPNARYNDPQVVRGSLSPSVLFCEWNNDASAYFQKVFLWGEGGLFGREVTPGITRLAGLNRAETAVRASQTAYPVVSPTVVLARKDDFPDALCGAPLAHALRAPILLVGTDKLDAEAREEIKRLRPSQIIVLGGTASISTTTAVEAQNVAQSARREAKLSNVLRLERLAGSDRYHTSKLIADELLKVKGMPSEVVLASGMDFPDALAASSYAARTGKPIILTRPNGLTQWTLEALASSGASSVYIVGGKAAVAEQVQTDLANGGYLVSRAAGSDRYETARLIVERGLAERVFGMQRFVVASGVTFPDAMTGGVLAARVNGPLLLTRPDSLPGPTAILVDTYAKRVLDVYVMGGPVAIDDAVVNNLQALVIGDVY